MIVYVFERDGKLWENTFRTRREIQVYAARRSMSSSEYETIVGEQKIELDERTVGWWPRRFVGIPAKLWKAVLKHYPSARIVRVKLIRMRAGGCQ